MPIIIAITLTPACTPRRAAIFPNKTVVEVENRGVIVKAVARVLENLRVA